MASAIQCQWRTQPRQRLPFRPISHWTCLKLVEVNLLIDGRIGFPQKCGPRSRIERNVNRSVTSQQRMGSPMKLSDASCR